MSYQLYAAVGPYDLLREIAGAPVAPLRHRMGLVPLRPGHEPELKNWSRTAAIGEVEADFFGGDGYQTASLWRAGQRVWGPSHTEEFPTARRPDWPINAVLARLGVVPEPRNARPEHHDLFHEVGLGAERDHEGWDRRAAEAQTYRTYDEWHADQQKEREAAARRAADMRLARIEAPLDGAEVMRVLEIPAGPQVGAAIHFLRSLVAERGELSRTDAEAALQAWNSQARTRFPSR
ncbi:hypothetical protein Aab01nite_65450 [Paractinoplanes abujensis]|uniref:Uncharacterized protein n=1 Tax=Paractinoplanes abujensis TaxID=882441 RepID=A0A7W7CPW4_9ACTN|nr:hypothetical protein [Actinoplanes abujensis]MBB4692547.1 hypothetical protein [Actinoplanes abujensis]GID22955.1 hypothetical protein Aab01nite_65450 [Actinoplanes abujensis]